MKESPFVLFFENATSKMLKKKFVIEKGANLLYELTLNRELKLSIKDTKNPKRGNAAFQTDICIFEKIHGLEIPRVVIEFKSGISTHDVITYSAKAGKHKKIYPGLRYGMIDDKHSAIPKRFFIHNENLDFFIAAKNYKKGRNLTEMIKKLITKELKTSQTLQKIYLGEKQFDYFKTEVSFRNLL